MGQSRRCVTGWRVMDHRESQSIFHPPETEGPRGRRRRIGGWVWLSLPSWIDVRSNVDILFRAERILMVQRVTADRGVSWGLVCVVVGHQRTHGQMNDDHMTHQLPQVAFHLNVSVRKAYLKSCLFSSLISSHSGRMISRPLTKWAEIKVQRESLLPCDLIIPPQIMWLCNFSCLEADFYPASISSAAVNGRGLWTTVHLFDHQPGRLARSLMLNHSLSSFLPSIFLSPSSLLLIPAKMGQVAAGERWNEEEGQVMEMQAEVHDFTACYQRVFWFKCWPGSFWLK